MAGVRLSGANFRQPRRWSFADCVFDEANWTLTVRGRRVSVETKPLELLRVLLLNAGKLVAKPDLLDAIWPDVAVVEASLPTAAGKLRRALDDDRRVPHIIETVPRIGYRLAVSVEVEDLSEAKSSATTTSVAAGAAHLPAAATGAAGHRNLAAVGGGLTIAIAAAAFAFAPSPRQSEAVGAPTFTQRDKANALRKLDVDAIERMLAAGWDPNTPFDSQGNDALNMLLNNCEWNPDQDKATMVLAARTLIDGGARIDRHNVWGDTPYSIAKAKRYCGPDHPVTKMLRAMCYNGLNPPGDRCLATYELKRRAKAKSRTAHS